MRKRPSEVHTLQMTVSSSICFKHTWQRMWRKRSTADKSLTIWLIYAHLQSSSPFRSLITLMGWDLLLPCLEQLQLYLYIFLSFATFCILLPINHFLGEFIHSHGVIYHLCFQVEHDLVSLGVHECAVIVTYTRHF